MLYRKSYDTIDCCFYNMSMFYSSHIIVYGSMGINKTVPLLFVQLYPHLNVVKPSRCQDSESEIHLFLSFSFFEI